MEMQSAVKKRKIMLLKMFFVLSLNFSLPVQAEGETKTPTEEEKQQALSREVERNKANYVQQMKNRWDNCRATCKATHTKPTAEICEGGSYCPRSYTDEECDQEFCQAEKLTYERYKRELDDMISAREEYEKRKDKQLSNSPLEQVKKKKKDTNLLAYVAAGTTAFLGYKAMKCCASKGCRESGQCAVLTGMTALAGLQTNEMFKKKNELGQTAQAMCAVSSDPECLGDSSGGGGDDDFVGTPPGCEEEGVPPDACFKITQHLDPPGECPPDDPNYPNCKNGNGPNSPPKPDMPGGGGPGTLSANEISPTQMSEKLSHIFKPKGGWPKGENPWVGSESFDYDKLPPDQKKRAGQLMAGLNQKNKDFLNKHGLGGGDYSGAGGLGNDEDGSGDGLSSNGGVGSTDSSGVSAGFSGSSVSGDGSRSLAGSEDSTAGNRGKPRSSLAQQMRDYLQKMKGAKLGANSNGYLGDKSVLVGSDNVGVREDNIFMMVHRMNRKLDREHRFIKTVLF